MRYCPQCRTEFSDEQRFCKDHPGVRTFLFEEELQFIGQTVRGKYHIEGLIDKGGMGAVYRARQLDLNRPVAFKIFNLDPSLNKNYFINRFKGEAELLAQLQSAYIVQIYEYGETEGGIPYIVMEWLEGISLKEKIKEKFRFNLGETLRIVQQVAAALVGAHGNDKPVIHFDLNPVNIMLQKQPGNREIVKVVDFGIAKVKERLSGAMNTTPMGKPEYSPPEQFDPGKVTEKVDIYALGVTFYEMLTGQLPFTHQITSEMSVDHVAAMPPNVRVLRPDVPAEIGEFIQRMMAKNPEARPDAEHVEDFCHMQLYKLKPLPVRLTDRLKQGILTAIGLTARDTTIIDRGNGSGGYDTRWPNKLVLTVIFCALLLVVIVVSWLVLSPNNKNRMFATATPAPVTVTVSPTPSQPPPTLAPSVALQTPTSSPATPQKQPPTPRKEPTVSVPLPSEPSSAQMEAWVRATYLKGVKIETIRPQGERVCTTPGSCQRQFIVASLDTAERRIEDIVVVSYKLVDGKWVLSASSK